MSKSVDAINLGGLPLSDLFQFVSDFIVKVEECDASKLKIEPQFIKLKAAFKKLDDALDKERKNDRTSTIASLVKLRIGIIKSILAVVKAMLNSTDEKVLEAAKRLKKLFDENKGITTKSFKAQSGDTTNMLQPLTGKLAADVELLGVGKFVGELGVVNKEIISHTNLRVDEWAAAENLNTASAKKSVISAYRMIEKLLDVYIETEGEANYSDFVTKLNVMIAGYSDGSRAATAQSDKPATPNTPVETPTEPTTPSEPIVEETHEEKLAKARAWTTIAEGEWKNGDYCWHNVNSVKTYWKLLDATQKEVKPYLSGGEAVWERV